MLLSVTTTHGPADDLGHLLHKRPDRFQSFELAFGKAHVFYPEAGAERCTACLLLDIDAVGLARGRNPDQDFLLAQYVNDRPYVASSFLSTALSQVFGSALNGHCRDRAELAATPIPLELRLEALPVRGGARLLRALFEPLGYEVDAKRLPLDERFPEWGDSHCWRVVLRRTGTLQEALAHLYVLIPAFDARKHYYVGPDELDKLLAKGAGWLAGHPAREEIVRRYLRRSPSLARQALARLTADDEPDDPEAEAEDAAAAPPPSLNDQRLAAALSELKESGARRVLDLGCGEGKLLRLLLAEPQFDEIVGVDASTRALESAERRLKLDRLSERQAERIKLRHGALTYRDRRLEGFDAAAAVEVVEHLDPHRLAAFAQALFGCARPRTVVMTTPNREHNPVWESLPAGEFRHGDHRFEWTRAEFQAWAGDVAGRHGYAVRFAPVGPEHPEFGPPTQMAVFALPAA